MALRNISAASAGLLAALLQRFLEQQFFAFCYNKDIGRFTIPDGKRKIVTVQRKPLSGFYEARLQKLGNIHTRCSSCDSLIVFSSGADTKACPGLLCPLHQAAIKYTPGSALLVRPDQPEFRVSGMASMTAVWYSDWRSLRVSVMIFPGIPGRYLPA